MNLLTHYSCVGLAPRVGCGCVFLSLLITGKAVSAEVILLKIGGEVGRITAKFA